MTKPAPEIIEEWKNIYEQYKDRLYPNKQTITELLNYLNRKYQLTEIFDEKLDFVIKGNAAENSLLEYQPKKDILKSRGFYVENSGAGKILYENQDKIFEGSKIIAGIEYETNFFLVEGSSFLYDELTAFHGLNERELSNYFTVARYISCLSKFGMLNSVIDK
jgi:hypothetical protein